MQELLNQPPGGRPGGRLPPNGRPGGCLEAAQEVGRLV